MQVYDPQHYDVIQCEQCRQYNDTVYRSLMKLLDDPRTRKTHLFEERYENIYIDAELIPDIKPILEAALQHAALLLRCTTGDLTMGFWFNLMQQDQVTTLHSHDDYDELLSGTYYIKVPDDSGKLILHLASEKKSINPREGQFVFFHPALPHEVTRQTHREPRISIGMNFGPARTG